MGRDIANRELMLRALVFIASCVVIVLSIQTLQNDALTISEGLKNDNLAIVIIFQVAFYICIVFGLIGAYGAIKWRINDE